MGLVEHIKDGDWRSVRSAIAKLSSIKLGPTSEPTFAGIKFTGLTASRLIASDANKALVSSNLIDWVTGTANRVTVSADDDPAGGIVLTGPQDIDVTASPTFVGLTLSGNLGCHDIVATGNISGVNITGERLLAIKEFASAGGIEEMVRITRTTLNTAITGIGAGIDFYIEDKDGDDFLVGRVATIIRQMEDGGGNREGSVIISAEYEENMRDIIDITANSGLGIADTDYSHFLYLRPAGLTANRDLAIVTGDADRILTFSGNPTLADWFDQSVKVAANVAFANVTSSGVIGTTIGSAAVPAVTFTVDSDTGIFRPAGPGSKWGVSVGGVEQLRMLGTVTTFNETGADIDFRVEGVGQTHALFVQGSDGNVGIGTTAPNAPLEVKGAKPGVVGGHQSGQLQVTGTGGEFYCAVITGHNAFNGNTQLWYLGNTSSSSHNDIAFINRQNAPIHFYTNNASRVTIDAAGNVGIGETAPQDKLEVNGTVLVKDALKFTQDDGAERIDSDADGTLDLYAGTSIDLHAGSQVNTDTVIRGATTLYRRYYHLSVGGFDPGASGATWTDPDGNTTGGWQLNAVGEKLIAGTDVHADWDGASDITIEISFALNVGGINNDTVDLQLIAYYAGEGDTATKTQTVEVATTTDGTQFKVYTASFTLDYDAGGNVIDVGDHITFVLNLETDTSEIDDIIITEGVFFYNTTHLGIESGDT